MTGVSGILFTMDGDVAGHKAHRKPKAGKKAEKKKKGKNGGAGGGGGKGQNPKVLIESFYIHLIP